MFSKDYMVKNQESEPLPSWTTLNRSGSDTFRKRTEPLTGAAIYFVREPVPNRNHYFRISVEFENKPFFCVFYTTFILLIMFLC